MTPAELNTALAASLRPLLDRVRRDDSAIKLPDGSRWTDEPLTDVRVMEHIAGTGRARGVCPIRAGESTTAAALLDLDSHGGETSWAGMVEAAQLLAFALDQHGLQVIPWRSSGGRGIHLYLLWEQPQDAYSVRELLTYAIGLAGFANGAKGVAAGQVEIFPKQDAVPVNGKGNQFIMPLAGASVPLVNWAPGERADALAISWAFSAPVPVRERPERPVSELEDLGIDLRVLRSALEAIPNSGADRLDYDTWRNVIFGIHHATGGSEEGLALAEEFSARYDGHDPDFLEQRVWPYIRDDRERATTAGTILKLARASGWTEPAELFFEELPEPSTACAGLVGSGVGVAGAAYDDSTVASAGRSPAIRGEDRIPGFVRDAKTGQPEAILGNLVRALESPRFAGVRIAKDQFSDSIMLSPAGGDEWRPFTDADYIQLRYAFSEPGADFKPISKDLMRDAVLLVADRNQFDSAILWLQGLNWDSRPRAERFFIDYFGAADTPYHRACGRYVWSALAARVFDPGCQADMAPILVGDQGLGKTSGISALVPSPAQFLEIDLSKADDDLARRMRGKLVAELSELRGLASRNAESVKAFVTRRYESWVPKYQEFGTEFARRLLIFGTTNKDHFLGDPTGARRWLPIAVSTVLRDEIARDRDQLWAEGAALWLAGGIDYRGAETLARDEHPQYQISDSWTDRFNAWLDTPPATLDDSIVLPPRMVGRFRMYELLTGALSMQPKEINPDVERRAAEVLRAMGWRGKHTNTGTQWVYGAACAKS